MTTITGNVSVTLNGVTNFSVGSDAYTWSGGWLLYVDTWVRDDLGPFSASYTLSGSNWDVDLLRFTGNVRATINDSATGTGRSIGTMTLGGLDGAGTNVVTMRNTFVDSIKGSGNVEKLTLGNAGAVVVRVEGGNDVVRTGAGEVEYLDLGRGNDSLVTGSGYVGTIIGSRGRDSITIGSGGADTVIGGGDADTVTLSRLSNKSSVVFVDGSEGVSDSSNKDSDTLVMTAFNKKIDIDLSQNDFVDTGYGRFLFRNFENISSGSASDVLKGSGDVNIIKGNGGNDHITGRGGADDLYGGSGKDVFIYNSISDSRNTSSARDTIFDFTSSDRIDLRAIDASTKSSGNQAFQFIGTKSFSGKAGELRYFKQSSDTYIQADVNGDRVADFAIHLDDAVTMQKGYFLL
ncbi:calcium-binding protein [Ciceribacter sp. L1K22]|uniref:M10 family metallopeptidase C-terminal domain-containing protein n=1 Tax=Ciceribacter sp. L1K22 TaxID=2820275 RepID=UPI001ABE9FC7|nr:calcium-binding protein [Ciceribacter sp. L1K22]MBO3758440.1 calcium-binding protein [Ciceribacter sp. L1K22]